MGGSPRVVPISILGTTAETICMICLENCILKNVVKHSLCSAIICKDCIQKMPDKQLKKCIYCRRATMEFYNKKYQNTITKNIKEFLNNDNINININNFGEDSPPILININDRNIRRSNRRRMSVRGINIDNLFQEKNCWDYVIDFILCICRLKTIHYICVFTVINAIILVCGLIILTVFTHEMNNGVELWVIYITGLITMAILYLCVACCMFITADRRTPIIHNGVIISNGNLFD